MLSSLDDDALSGIMASLAAFLYIPAGQSTLHGVSVHPFR